jgi:sugar phosphate isomerase/epimerase
MMNARLVPLVALLAGLCPGRAADLPPAATNPFFPFCMDVQDAKKRSLPEQAALLKELGYDGAGHLWLGDIPERLQTLDAAGLKLFQITTTVDLTPGKPGYEPAWKDVLPLLKGRHVQFDLLINGLKPRDPAGETRAMEILRELSDMAKDSGSVLLLYPHTGSWLDRIEDAVHLADKINRPNVQVMFNLCHWLRVEKSRDYRAALKLALPRLGAVSINGAEESSDAPDWSGYIQPLGRGSFDVFGFLRALRELGYTGPIGLQCYGLGGDARVHLAESMKAWRDYSARLPALPPSDAALRHATP